MRLLTRKEFLATPSGTIYSKYESLGNLEGLAVKTATWDNDWIYYSLIGEFDAENTEEEFAIEESNESFTLDLEATGRDGLFDEDQVFAVYEKDDVVRLRDRLNDLLSEY